MKDRIIALIQKHPLGSLFASAMLAILLLYVITSSLATLRHWREDKAVDQLEQKSTAAQNAAAKENINARAEDLNRERTIRPELERTRAAVGDARQRARKAETDYENARKNPVDSNIDVRALHDRNCADLRELYPNEPIDFCR